MELINGTIIKGVGGFYYIKTAGDIIECRARGIFRKENITPLVGDNVKIKLSDEKTGIIWEILPRDNALIRPPVANVSQAAVVFSTENPRPNLTVIDKFIAVCEYNKLDILICINKIDLSCGREYEKIYKDAGFDVITLSASENKNIDILCQNLKDKITVFAGNSGVGKSSLLNAVLGEEIFKTGEVSEKVDRGRHTTRHSELLPLPFGGYIIDTPGFSSFDISRIPCNELFHCFREFDGVTEQCRFLDCSHTVEKGCGILSALKSGKISKSRHDNYTFLYNELKNGKRW